MQGDVTVKGPVAVVILVVLIISVSLNIYKFTQSPQVMQISGAGQSGAAAALPGGERDPLTHVPQNPQDAVGMPDGSGGTGTTR